MIGQTRPQGAVAMLAHQPPELTARLPVPQTVNRTSGRPRAAIADNSSGRPLLRQSARRNAVIRPISWPGGRKTAEAAASVRNHVSDSPGGRIGSRRNASESAGGEATHRDDTDPGPAHQSVLQVPAGPMPRAPYLTTVADHRNPTAPSPPGRADTRPAAVPGAPRPDG